MLYIKYFLIKFSIAICEVEDKVYLNFGDKKRYAKIKRNARCSGSSLPIFHSIYSL